MLRGVPLLLFIAAVIATVSAFQYRKISRTTRHERSATTGNDLDDATRTRLVTLVETNKVLLFMKGNKLFPQCGFSNTACRILDQFNVPYETVDVLSDDKIRSGVKVFSAWPTIPQLYVNGEFVGGSDIMLELYQSGELAEMIEIAAAN